MTKLVVLPVTIIGTIRKIMIILGIIDRMSLYTANFYNNNNNTNHK